MSANILNDSNILEYDETIGRVRIRILRIMATIKYNESDIQCNSYTSGEEVSKSDPTVMLVQGMY